MWNDLAFSFPWLIALFQVFFTIGFVRDHVWHPYVTAGKTHMLNTFFKTHGKEPVHRDFSIHSQNTSSCFYSCLVLFSIVMFVPMFIVSHLLYFCPVYCMLCVVSIFVINLVLPIGILRPILKFSSFMVFNWCSMSLTSSAVRTTSTAIPRSDSFYPSLFPSSSGWAFLNYQTPPELVM